VSSVQVIGLCGGRAALYILYMYAASTVRVSGLIEAGNSADLCILGDRFLELAAIQGGRSKVCLTQQSDYGQLLQQQQHTAGAALDNADDSSPDLRTCVSSCITPKCTVQLV